LLLLFGVLTTSQGADDTKVVLTGIVRVAGQPRAVLELRRASRPPLELILMAQERNEGIQLTSVNETNAEVTLTQDGQPVTLSMPKLNGAPGPDNFNFDSTSLDQALNIYQILANVTVIRAPVLPGAKLHFQLASTASAETARAALASLFLRHGVLIRPHGPLCAFAVPRSSEKQLDGIIDRLGPVPATSGDESILRGMIRFMASDSDQVLEIYSDLARRTLLRQSFPSPYRLSLASQTDLSRAQTVYLLDASLALCDIAMVPRGDKFVFAVRPSIVAALKHVPPKRATPLTDADTKLSGTEVGAFYGAPIKTVLAKYAALIGRTALPVDFDPAVALSFRPPSEMTRAEAVYALDALAAINNIAFEWVDPGSVRAAPSPVFRNDK
jgi:hypothetical protein